MSCDFCFMFVLMPTESKMLTEQSIRKERALASKRQMHLRQLEGKLLWAEQVEQAWASAFGEDEPACINTDSIIAMINYESKGSVTQSWISMPLEPTELPSRLRG